MNENVTGTKNMMTEEEFKEYLNSHLNLKSFECVGRFRSVLRALKRGHITPYGTIIPKRPFNNRKPTLGRQMNERKKIIYAEIIDKQGKAEGVQ